MQNTIFNAPNGLRIHQNTPDETKYVFREVFEDLVYLRHGITIHPGDVIFDVGANIGIFSLFIMENFPSSQIHAFEPSPPIAALLQMNVARYGPSVCIHTCGIAETSRTAKFTHYPNYSIMSGFNASTENDENTLKRGIRSQISENQIDPNELSNRALDRMVKVALGNVEEYTCQLKSLSEIIDEHQISSIGLLKIDAEGSELSVLSGIMDRHWPIIRQIVMEIHDPNGSGRNEILRILESRGYSCVTEEEKRLAGSGIINCYAIQTRLI